MAMVTVSGAGRYFREHVTRVVVQPLGLGAIALGREGDRAADLDDHLGARFLEARHHEVVVFDIRGEVPGRGVAHVEMQDPGAGVVAIHRRLDLLVPGHGDVGRVARQPRRPIRRRGDDQWLHVLGIQRVVCVTHELFSCLGFRVSVFCSDFWFGHRHRHRVGLPDGEDVPFGVGDDGIPRRFRHRRLRPHHGIRRDPRSVRRFDRATRRGRSAPSCAAPESDGTSARRRCPWTLPKPCRCASSRCRAPCRSATRAAFGRTRQASPGPRHKFQSASLT